jgi:hypothetical protein
MGVVRICEVGLTMGKIKINPSMMCDIWVTSSETVQITLT